MFWSLWILAGVVRFPNFQSFRPSDPCFTAGPHPSLGITQVRRYYGPIRLPELSSRVFGSSWWRLERPPPVTISLSLDISLLPEPDSDRHRPSVLSRPLRLNISRVRSVLFGVSRVAFTHHLYACHRHYHGGTTKSSSYSRYQGVLKRPSILPCSLTSWLTAFPVTLAGRLPRLLYEACSAFTCVITHILAAHRGDFTSQAPPSLLPPKAMGLLPTVNDWSLLNRYFNLLGGCAFFHVAQRRINV
jgi:hypothetical protein